MKLQSAIAYIFLLYCFFFYSESIKGGKTPDFMFFPYYAESLL
jgi:hypothetical protein